ncbi:MAG: signal peptidase II, partial [Lachnospiraceae bacterium]|nr:signal peptidase II [Lachnospiraceae bacterium]
MNKKKKRLLLIDVLLMFLLIMADQITKYLAIINLRNHEPWVLWDGVFELHYLENRGAAFGMLQDQKMLFILIAMIILAVIVYVLFKTPYQKMYTKLHSTLVLIASG